MIPEMSLKAFIMLASPFVRLDISVIVSLIAFSFSRTLSLSLHTIHLYLFPLPYDQVHIWQRYTHSYATFHISSFFSTNSLTACLIAPLLNFLTQSTITCEQKWLVGNNGLWKSYLWSNYKVCFGSTYLGIIIIILHVLASFCIMTYWMALLASYTYHIIIWWMYLYTHVSFY